MEKETMSDHQKMMADIAARQQLTIKHTNTVDRLCGEWFGRWEGTDALGQKIRVFVKKIEVLADDKETT